MIDNCMESWGRAAHLARWRVGAVSIAPRAPDSAHSTVVVITIIIETHTTSRTYSRPCHVQYAERRAGRPRHYQLSPHESLSCRSDRAHCKRLCLLSMKHMYTHTHTLSLLPRMSLTRVDDPFMSCVWQCEVKCTSALVVLLAWSHMFVTLYAALPCRAKQQHCIAVTTPHLQSCTHSARDVRCGDADIYMLRPGMCR